MQTVGSIAARWSCGCLGWSSIRSRYLPYNLGLGGSYRDQYSVLAFLAWANFHMIKTMEWEAGIQAPKLKISAVTSKKSRATTMPPSLP
jgi:hypothetical protein